VSEAGIPIGIVVMVIRIHVEGGIVSFRALFPCLTYLTARSLLSYCPARVRFSQNLIHLPSRLACDSHSTYPALLIQQIPLLSYSMSPYHVVQDHITLSSPSALRAAGSLAKDA
jgi:hypothetical protein